MDAGLDSLSMVRLFFSRLKPSFVLLITAIAGRYSSEMHCSSSLHFRAVKVSFTIQAIPSFKLAEWTVGLCFRRMLPVSLSFPGVPMPASLIFDNPSACPNESKKSTIFSSLTSFQVQPGYPNLMHF